MASPLGYLPSISTCCGSSKQVTSYLNPLRLWLSAGVSVTPAIQTGQCPQILRKLAIAFSFCLLYIAVQCPQVVSFLHFLLLLFNFFQNLKVFSEGGLNYTIYSIIIAAGTLPSVFLSLICSPSTLSSMQRPECAQLKTTSHQILTILSQACFLNLLTPNFLRATALDLNPI